MKRDRLKETRVRVVRFEGIKCLSDVRESFLWEVKDVTKRKGTVLCSNRYETDRLDT